MVSSIGGTWHRCARCHYAWRGLGPVLAAVPSRPQLDASAQPEVVDRDVQPLSKLSDLARVGRPAPTISQAQLSDQGPSVDQRWLADVEAHFERSHNSTVESSSVAVEQSASEDLPTPHDTHPELDDWLDRLEDASPVRCPDAEVRHHVERWADDAEPARPRIHQPDEPGAIALQDDHQASELDDLFDRLEEASPVPCPDAEVRHHVERRADDPEVGQPRIQHPEEPGATALQDDHPASAVPLSVSLVRLGTMDADLLRVGDTFARSDAAFLRLVSRWHPVTVPVA